MSSLQRICILGSTGSIGCSTLDVISRHSDKFIVDTLTAHNNVELMIKQCLQFTPRHVVMGSVESINAVKESLIEHGLCSITFSFGPKALEHAAAEKHSTIVVAAIVGSSGLLPTLAAVKASKRVLLANKEALVTSGQIFIDAVAKYGAELLPIDSEHNAIFQCLPHFEQQRVGFCQLNNNGITKILLTGSGGPFRTLANDKLAEVTPEQACAHPNWDMGRKISVDSATMMNKGLEFIETKWLFNVGVDDIKVVLHPQSTIHSMVQYQDGSVIAQMGNPDMRTPIAHALAFPNRIDSGVKPLDFFTTASFDFEDVDFNKYPNLALAIKACELGQGACTALNAANEVAVKAFLDNKIKFTDIYTINEQSVKRFENEDVACIDDVVQLDEKVRAFSDDLISQYHVNPDSRN